MILILTDVMMTILPDQKLKTRGNIQGTNIAANNHSICLQKRSAHCTLYRPDGQMDKGEADVEHCGPVQQGDLSLTELPGRVTA